MRECVTANGKNVELFKQAERVMSTLMQMLNRDEPYIAVKSAKLLSLIMRSVWTLA